MFSYLIRWIKQSKDKNSYKVGIEFETQFSNGSLSFLVIDEDFQWLGCYVIVSPAGVASIVDNDWSEINLNLKTSLRLKRKAREFFDATTASNDTHILEFFDYMGD